MGEWMNDADLEDFWQGHDYARESANGCPDVAAALELAALMSEISEDQYCAGWEYGLEASLFAFAYEGAAYGTEGPSPKQRQGLMELARRCDGWWIHRERDLEFVRMEVWTEMYKPF